MGADASLSKLENLQKKIQISTLNPLDYNPRDISEEGLARLAVSIREHTKAIPEEERGDGFRLTTTITVNKNGNRIIGGHQRTQALEALDQDWIDSRDITWVELEPDSAHEKALNVTLNSDRIGGTWDENALESLLEDIKIEDVDFFNTIELVEIEVEDVDFGTADLDFTPDSTKDDDDDEYEVPEKKAREPIEPMPGDTGLIPHKFKGEPGTNITCLSGNSTGSDDSVSQTATIIPSPSGEKQKIAEPQLFPLSYAVTEKQRAAVLSAIALAKENGSFESSAEALAEVCEKYVEIEKEE